MRKIGKAVAGPLAWFAGFMLLALVFAVAAPATASAAGAALTARDVVTTFGPLVIGMVVIPWKPAMDRGQLEAIVNPQEANEPECVPWQLYDTQAIASAAAGPFVFFQSINVDKTMSNMEGPGQLPDPQYLVVHYVAADLLQAPTATALANEPNQALVNVEAILKTARATVTFNMSNKRYGPFSLTMCHSTGGATFSGYGYGTAANGTSSGVVNNGIPGSGGFPFGGAMVIPPKIGFDVTVSLAAAQTLSATVNLRISLVGVLYRRVL
jgi:hypothetical protein